MALADLSPEMVQGLTAAWLFLLGGAVGSFLNVVIHRVPAGTSILWPGSHCPACRHPIRWYDNLPVLSWMALRGRCRDCGTRISVRYPVVEAATAGLFLLLAVVELFSRGVNLPPRPLPVDGGAVAPALSLGQAAGIYAYHLLLLCTLLAAALVEYDHLWPPPLLYAPAGLVGLVAPIVWPHLHAVPAWGTGEGWLGGLVDGGVGLLAGFVLGCLVLVVLGPTLRFGMVFAATCVGLFLGWQAAIALCAAMAVCYLPFRLAWSRLPERVAWVPATAWLGLLTLVWILAWGWLVARCPVLG